MTEGGYDEARWRDALRRRGVSEAAQGRLAAFVELQSTFGGAMDLTGPAARARAWAMVEESVAAEAVLPTSGVLLDVGSGNGFPAVPLLAVRPELEGVLLEPRERRWAFLREVVRDLGLRASVERCRVEAYRGAGADALTVRAVAPRVWSELVERLVRPGGVVCWWGPEARGADPPVTGAAPVLTLPLPKGRIVVWRRCST